MSVELFLKLWTLFAVVGIGFGAARAGLRTLSLDQYGLGPRWSVPAGMAVLKLLLLPALVGACGVWVFHLDGVPLSVLAWWRHAGG